MGFIHLPRGFVIMKKLICSLVLLSSIASAQPGFAAGSVIDQCPYTPAWKCNGMPAGNINTFDPINSLSNSVSSWWWTFYRDWFENSI